MLFFDDEDDGKEESQAKIQKVKLKYSEFHPKHKKNTKNKLKKKVYQLKQKQKKMINDIKFKQNNPYGKISQLCEDEKLTRISTSLDIDQELNQSPNNQIRIEDKENKGKDEDEEKIYPYSIVPLPGMPLYNSMRYRRILKHFLKIKWYLNYWIVILLVITVSQTMRGIYETFEEFHEHNPNELKYLHISKDILGFILIYCYWQILKSTNSTHVPELKRQIVVYIVANLILAITDMLFYFLPVVQKYHEDYSLTFAIVIRGCVMGFSLMMLMWYKILAVEIQEENAIDENDFRIHPKKIKRIKRIKHYVQKV